MAVELLDEAGYGGWTPPYKTFKVLQSKEGMAEPENIWAILPVRVNQNNDNFWLYQKTHWGDKAPNPRNSDKPFSKPWLCVEVSRKVDDKKQILVHCARCDRIQQQKDALEGRKSDLKKLGKSEDDIKGDKQVEELNGWLKRYNTEQKFIVAAINLQGEAGILPLPIEVFNKLKARRLEWQDKKKIQIVSWKGTGLFMHFKRSGTGFSTSYDVEPAMRELGNGSLGYQFLKLTEAEKLRACEVLPDLNTLGVVLTPEQVRELVDNEGDMGVVDRIMKRTRKTNQVPQENSPENEEIELAVAISHSRPHPLPPVQAPTPAPVEAPPVDNSDPFAEEAPLVSEAALLAAEIGSSQTLEGLRSLVPRIKKLSADEQASLREPFKARQRALTPAPTAPAPAAAAPAPAPKPAPKAEPIPKPVQLPPPPAEELSGEDFMRFFDSQTSSPAKG